jgi:hypothetical protein
MNQEVKLEGIEANLVEDSNQDDEGVTNKPYSNNNQASITHVDIVQNMVTFKKFALKELQLKHLY